MGERHVRNVEVEGSSPLSSTILPLKACLITDRPLIFIIRSSKKPHQVKTEERMKNRLDQYFQITGHHSTIKRAFGPACWIRMESLPKLKSRC